MKPTDNDILTSILSNSVGILQTAGLSEAMGWANIVSQLKAIDKGPCVTFPCTEVKEELHSGLGSDDLDLNHITKNVQVINGKHYTLYLSTGIMVFADKVGDLNEYRITEIRHSHDLLFGARITSLNVMLAKANGNWTLSVGDPGYPDKPYILNNEVDFIECIKALTSRTQEPKQSTCSIDVNAGKKVNGELPNTDCNPVYNIDGMPLEVRVGKSQINIVTCHTVCEHLSPIVTIKDIKLDGDKTTCHYTWLFSAAPRLVSHEFRGELRHDCDILKPLLSELEAADLSEDMVWVYKRLLLNVVSKGLYSTDTPTKPQPSETIMLQTNQTRDTNKTEATSLSSIVSDIISITASKKLLELTNKYRVSVVMISTAEYRIVAIRCKTGFIRVEDVSAHGLKLTLTDNQWILSSDTDQLHGGVRHLDNVSDFALHIHRHYTNIVSSIDIGDEFSQLFRGEPVIKELPEESCAAGKEQTLTIHRPTDVLLIPKVTSVAFSRDVDKHQMADDLCPRYRSDQGKTITFLTHIEQCNKIIGVGNEIWVDDVNCLCTLGLIPVDLIEGISLVPTHSELIAVVAANYWLKARYQGDCYPEYEYEAAMDDYIESPNAKENIVKYLAERKQ